MFGYHIIIHRCDYHLYRRASIGTIYAGQHNLRTNKRALWLLCCTLPSHKISFSTMTSPYHYSLPSSRNDIIRGQPGTFDIIETYILHYLPFLRVQFKQIRAWGRAFSQLPAASTLQKLKAFATFRFVFILLWALTLCWGEGVVFKHRVRNCAWDGWESWVGKGFLTT